MAAEAAGRVCRGIELDPLYVDTIVRRYHKVAGTAVTLGDTGETFEALTQSRGACGEQAT